MNLKEQKGKQIGQGYTAEIFEWESDKILKLYRKNLPDFCVYTSLTLQSVFTINCRYVPKHMK
jgi:hypothetical protein